MQSHQVPHSPRPTNLSTIPMRLAMAAAIVGPLLACGQSGQSGTPTGPDESAQIMKEQKDSALVDLRRNASQELMNTEPDTTKAPAQEPPTRRALGKAMGEFHMTYYWIANESKRSVGNHAIVDKSCKRIAKVSEHFKRRLVLEGSGKLKDGRLVTTAGGCKCGGPCFWVASDQYPWGAGVAQRPLSPFRSIAVDPKQIKIGSSLYVSELDGLTMPGSGDTGGFVHDGCVVADDRGGGVRGKQIDFFAAKRGHYKNFFKRHKINTVTVYAGGERCRDHAHQHDALRLAVLGAS